MAELFLAAVSLASVVASVQTGHWFATPFAVLFCAGYSYVAALVIRFTGFLAIDPILGMGFGVVLVWASWGILKGSLRILLQAVPEDLDLGAVKDAVEALPGVRDAHHLHAWALTTGKNVVSLHALVDRGVERQALQRRIFEVLRDDFDVYFSTVQLETECLEREEARAIDATWATDV